MADNDLTKDLVAEGAPETGEETTAPVSTTPEDPAPESPASPEGDLTPEELEQAYEQSMKEIQEGEVAKGTIVAVENDYVVVDIGYKSEGQININEFRDAEGEIKAEVGQQVDVLLERAEDEDGTIILSKEKAAKIKVWDEISRVYNDDGMIHGTIVGRVKGGMSVDIGVNAFLPGSQVDLRAPLGTAQ